MTPEADEGFAGLGSSDDSAPRRRGAIVMPGAALREKVGEVIDIGGLRVGAAGVEMKGRLTPWEDVTRLEAEHGYAIFERRGRTTNLTDEEVANVGLLAALLAQARGTRQG